jgi:hypothetical protein
MPNKTFLTFDQKTSLADGDYIVGYKADGSAEFRTNLLDLAKYIYDTTAVPKYALGTSAVSVNEGSSITFTLSTTFVPNGINIPYTITGITSADINAPLTGNFTVANNTAQFTIVADLSTEGPETMTLTLDGISPAVSTSLLINDTSVTPITYAIGRSASSVNEGSSMTFTLSTTGVVNGTNVPYTITGISANDLTSGSLTGNFTVSNNIATVTITASADQLTEGAETATITLDNNAASSSVVINDTSNALSPYTTLLLNANGTNGSQAIVDSSGNNTVTAVGNAQISTAQSKFGGSSLYFNGNGDYLQLPTGTSNFNFGTGNYTIEGWLYASDVTVVNRCIINIGTPGSNVYLRQRGTSLAYYDSTNTIIVQDLTFFAANTWAHFALIRSGTTIQLYKNGTLVSTGTSTTNHTNTTGPTIGGISGGNYYFGYMDDFRITKGIARYTSNFTPPASELTP